MTWWGKDGVGFGLLVMTTAGVMAGVAALVVVTILRPDLVARSILDVIRGGPEPVRK